MARQMWLQMGLGLAAALGLLVVGGAALGDGDPARGQKVFRKCSTCHTAMPRMHKIGPSLAGVVGRRAGSAEGYRYSRAMTQADLVWTEDRLDAFLSNPAQFLPGTRMAFPGLREDDERRHVIAYLRSISN